MGLGRAYLPRESECRNQVAPRANAGREGTPMLTVVTWNTSTPAAPGVATVSAMPVSAATGTTGAAGGSLIDEIVRDGARRMLAAALEAEVAAYIAAHVHQVDEQGRRLVVRNGHAQPRQ